MKTTFTLALLCSFVFVQAQPAGPLNGTQFTNLSCGGVKTWSNEGNLSASDNIYAQIGNIPGTAGSFSDYIVSTGFNFDLPDGVSILGVKVDVERSDPNLITSDYMVRLVKGGAVTGINQAGGTPFPAADAYISYGGAEDLWGESLSFKDIENNDFGVAISVRRLSDLGVSDGRIDHIRITVYYSFLTLPVQIEAFTATKNNEVVKLDWKVATESSIAEYVVERSADSRNFKMINSLAAKNAPGTKYSLTDFRPFPGISYYRLRIREENGTIKYSTIASINLSTLSDLKISPSPWAKGQELFISNPHNEKLLISFFNEKGEKIGEASTDSRIVPSGSLQKHKGVVYYQVTDAGNLLVTKGNFLVN